MICFKARYTFKLIIKVHNAAFIHQCLRYHIDNRILKFWRRIIDIQFENVYPYLLGGVHVMILDLDEGIHKTFLRLPIRWEKYIFELHEFDFANYIKYFYNLAIESIVNKSHLDFTIHPVQIFYKKPRLFLYKKSDKLVLKNPMYQFDTWFTTEKQDMVVVLDYGRGKSESKFKILFIKDCDDKLTKSEYYFKRINFNNLCEEEERVLDTLMFR